MSPSTSSWYFARSFAQPRNLIRAVVAMIVLIMGSGAFAQKPRESNALIATLESLEKSMSGLQNKFTPDFTIQDRCMNVRLKSKRLLGFARDSVGEKVPDLYLESFMPYITFINKALLKKTPDPKLVGVLEELSDELDIKATFAASSRGNVLANVETVVNTYREGKLEGGFTIWYVVKGWKDDQGHYYRFGRMSTPSKEDLPPGNYYFWSEKGSTKSKPETISLGKGGRTKDLIDLNIP